MGWRVWACGEGPWDEHLTRGRSLHGLGNLDFSKPRAAEPAGGVYGVCLGSGPSSEGLEGCWGLGLPHLGGTWSEEGLPGGVEDTASELTFSGFLQCLELPHRLPQRGWLTLTELYPHMVLEAAV